MAYKFPFKTLLKHRQRIEESARREFIKAQRDAEDCLQLIKDHYARRDFARTEAERISLEGGQRSNELRDIAEYISGMNLIIDRERSRARELLQIAEEKRDILVAAAQEVKILEKLREKRAAEYKLERRRREEKMNQDLNTMRFKTGEGS